MQTPQTTLNEYPMVPYEGVKPSGDGDQLPTAGTPESERTATPSNQASFREGEQLITPENQANDPVDLDTTRAIHSMIESEPSLAAAARYVDIITNDGIVTLRGHVQSPGDKAALEAMARQAVGVNRVDDDILVTPNR
jgi:hypothetical protein